MGQPRVQRATATALACPGPVTSQDIYVDANSVPSSIPSSSPAFRGKLQELSVDQVHNKSLARSSPLYAQAPDSFRTKDLEGGPVKSRSSLSRGFRRRPQVDSDTFEPLDVVLEESTLLSIPRSAATVGSPSSLSQQSRRGQFLYQFHKRLLQSHIKSPHQRYQDHLAGQFDWLLACPAPVSYASDHGSSDDGENETKVYGCNLLSRETLPNSSAIPSTDTFSLLATPLTLTECSSLGFDCSQLLDHQLNMSLVPPPLYESHQNPPLKVPEVVEVREQAVSPSLTLISERSSNYSNSSRNGSFSIPRIEDSLEELDKLEDELEAIDAVTQPRRIASPVNGSSSSKHLEPPSTSKKATISKRVSIAGMSATVRVKPSAKSAPALRRSTSLVFRDKKQDEAPEGAPKLRSQPSRGRLSISQSASLHAPIKSTKPPTVPNFELPGEAVARRLKEQREARRAQADSQKAYVPPPRPKSSKPPTKANFELPGEAFSRRKREEREARLKAQEEEERKKREFKARPVRTSITPASIPRETIASLARQGKLPQEDDGAKHENKTKRLSVTGSRAVPPSEAKPSHGRGRLSTATSREDLSRGTSTSGGSASGKRATLTVEEAHQLKLRGKEIFQRDNTSFQRDREREKREREAATRLAREQAAERSRIASREWAEKKKRKEQQALRDVLRDGSQDHWIA
ncbi:hypothetical protein B0J15DRAFT_536496 [Fusarium solani]|uniref:Carboxylesterase family protein n=1 Tax=Fusarium solani TaxID=169388 RepID=A0A9P9H3Y7_FUSSL|nr:uncharacterized protein B0J15DRAFT_536496 [Fusarium solani]KAH7250576.1 hypothetical protein B0J15DRAFT_536496 [Fusarium solani]